MKSLIILRDISVSNANAISGFTYGFPAPTHFLGFTHALARLLPKDLKDKIGRTAIICHRHQLVAHEMLYGDRVLSLTRNPLTKEGKTASFVEEGRMHMTVSLLIECNFSVRELPGDSPDESERRMEFEQDVQSKVMSRRLAGGRIDGIDSVRFWTPPEEKEEKALKRVLRSLLPGFCLVSRAKSLAEHHRTRTRQDSTCEFLDSWLDFVALKYQAVRLEQQEEANEKDEVRWEVVPKPVGGWLVPLQVGYRAISETYEPGVVRGLRDEAYPSAFVEAAYSVGSWISPHRIRDLDKIMWGYQHTEGWYLCTNNFE